MKNQPRGKRVAAGVGDRLLLREEDLPPLLRAEEEVTLGITIEAGVFAQEQLEVGVDDVELRRDLSLLAVEGRRAFDRFITANYRMSAYWARRRFHAGAAGTLTVEDLTAEGVFGLVRAVQKWDYRLGFKFSTYATRWIKHFQERAVVKSWPVAVTFAEWEECRQITRARIALTEQLQRQPTIAEIADACDSTSRRVRELGRLMAAPDSLDRPAFAGGGKPTSLGDLIADHRGDQGEDDGGQRTELAHQLVEGLTDRERQIVGDVFGFGGKEPLPIEDVAAIRGMPVELVRGALESALARMRAAGGDHVPVTMLSGAA